MRGPYFECADAQGRGAGTERSLTKRSEDSREVPGERDDESASAVQRSLDDLYSSPEFLIRRAHQIATAAFAEACSDLDLTPSQYAALFALRQHASAGQNALGRLIALDRSTTSLVVRSLRERGLVSARSGPSDRRKSFLELTDQGRLVLAQAEQRSAQSTKALLSVFDERQAEHFLAMLRKLSRSVEPPAPVDGSG